MKLVISASGLALAAAVLLSSGTGVFAQRFYAPRDLVPNDPSYSGVPNIPDEQGCVKLCIRDTSPCDPPQYKRTDGRCVIDH